MALHPAFLASTLILAVPWLFWTLTRGVEEFPALTNASWEAQMPMLIVAAGAYFAANLAAVRSYRFATTQAESVQPMPRWAQVAAQFAAVGALSVVAGAMMLTHLLTLSSAAGAAGTILYVEAAASPATVLLAGGLGVTVGHLARGFAAGAVSFAILGAVVFAGLVDGRSWRWLTPVALEDAFAVPAVPTALAQRPAGWHLLWILTLLAAAAVLTLLVVGLGRRTGMLAPPVLAAVAVLAGSMQLAAPTLQQTPAWHDAFAHPETMQTCQKRDAVTYCAFPDFTSRIDAWHAVVEAQSDALPPGVDPGPFAVRQRLSMPASDGIGFTLPVEEWDAGDAATGTPEAIPVSTRWAGTDSDSYGQTQVLAFSLGVAHRLATDERAPVPPSGGGAIELCGGRGVVIAWLATGTNDAGRHAVEVVLSRGDLIDATILDSSTSYLVGFGETELIRSLLDRDAAEVTTTMHRHWGELLDPATDAEEAAALLGVRGLAELPEGTGLCAG